MSTRQPPATYGASRRKMRSSHDGPDLFPEHPTDVIRSRVFTTPYAEDDIGALVERIGASQILFGSDWPHGAGLAEPGSYRDLLDGLSSDDVAAIMRDNLTRLIDL